MRPCRPVSADCAHHQSVTPDWQDDHGFEKAREFRGLAGRGPVSGGDLAVSWGKEPPLLTKVSGRKIPFPGRRFARLPADKTVRKMNPDCVHNCGEGWRQN